MTKRTTALFISGVAIATGCIALAVSKAEPKNTRQQLSELEEQSRRRASEGTGSLRWPSTIRWGEAETGTA